MRILIAPQDFKGTLTATEAAAAIAEGVRRALPDASLDAVPMADGGPGTVDAMLFARPGERRTIVVCGPMGEPVAADWALMADGSAVIEMATAVGLVLVEPGQRETLRASTYGCGQLLKAALDAGCRELLFGTGGSATIDGAAGLAQALGYRLLDTRGRELARGGAALLDLDRIDASGADERLRSCRVLVACDVDCPVLGETGTVQVFGPQKGATPDDVVVHEKALRRLAEVVHRDLGVDMLSMPWGGPGGGMAAGLAAFAGAELRPGGWLIAEALGLRDRLRAADVCITGEGSFDSQSTMGKGTQVVAQEAALAAVPCYIVAGRIGDERAVAGVGLVGAIAATPAEMPWDEIRQQAAVLVADAAERLARTAFEKQTPSQR